MTPAPVPSPIWTIGHWTRPQEVFLAAYLAVPISEREAPPMAENPVRVLLGTTKGAFVLEGTAARDRWTVRGPYCDGWPINHVIGDPATDG